MLTQSEQKCQHNVINRQISAIILGDNCNWLGIMYVVAELAFLTADAKVKRKSYLPLPNNDPAAWTKCCTNSQLSYTYKPVLKAEYFLYGRTCFVFKLCYTSKSLKKLDLCQNH